MESKNINIFAFIMIAVMCAFSIYIGLNCSNGKNGLNGKNTYELAVEEGEFSGSLTDYLKSLKGEKGDKGDNITVEDVYEAYLLAKNKTSAEYSLTDFILDYYPESIYDSAEQKTLTELATNTALRSTVDICYSYYMNSKILNLTTSTLTDKTTGEQTSIYLLSNASNNNPPMGVCAGSGVIYKIDESEAYIITNYHVVYISNYSNDDTYKVYKLDNSKYLTGYYDTADVKLYEYAWYQYQYIKEDDFVEAPLSTHFLPSYSIYLNGYQDKEYALSATFVGGSAENDIAVLRIENNEQNAMLFDSYYGYKQVEIADSTQIRQGQGVVAVGNPLIPSLDQDDEDEINSSNSVKSYVEAYEKVYIKSLCLTATDGVVSNISEYQKFSSVIDSSDANDLRLIRVSAAINAGNSGGGLYDIYGRLIGIVNGKIASSDYDNVGYAIPINKAVAIADKVIAECNGSTKVSTSFVTLKKLGLTVENSVEQQDIYFNSTDQVWVYDTSVKVKISSTVGINVGDRITAVKIGDETFAVHYDYEFADVLLKIKVPETSTTIQVFLKGNETPINVAVTAVHFEEIK